MDRGFHVFEIHEPNPGFFVDKTCKTTSPDSLKNFYLQIEHSTKTTIRDLTPSDLLIYLGSTVLDETGNVMGFVVLEIPISAINKIMFGHSEASGLGKTGEAYLVGSDYQMRSNSRFAQNVGLATITPCAGFVPVWASPGIGTIAGLVCYFAVNFKNKMKWDDALDVWGVHGVGGVLGTILLGVFASKAINSAGADGLMFGDGSFFIKQLVAVVAASIYAFIFTYIMLIVINLITPVKVAEEIRKVGLDEGLHGEKAYDEGVL